MLQVTQYGGPSVPLVLPVSQPALGTHQWPSLSLNSDCIWLANKTIPHKDGFSNHVFNDWHTVCTNKHTILCHM